MAETRSLHRKLAQIMYEAERIPKNGTAPAVMGSFKFVQVGDAADFIRKALGESVISMTPTQIDVIGQTEHETKSGGTMTTLDLRVTWTLTDGESGESTTIVSYGAGADTGDKYSGKAMTNAMKYALLAGFQLSTGDDPEMSDTSDRQRRPRAEPRGMSREQATELASATEPVLIGPYTGTGKFVVRKSGPADGFLKPGPDGSFFLVAFQEAEGKTVQVEAKGHLATDIYDAASEKLDGLVCTIEGDLYRVPWSKDGKAMPPYQRVVLARIITPSWTLPEPVQAGPGLFDPADGAELDSIPL